jgi:hypothetical protein
MRFTKPKKYNVYTSSFGGAKADFGLEVSTKLIDTATPFLKDLANQYPFDFRRALKSAGWWLRAEIRQGIRSGAPGGQKYPQFSKIKSSRNEYMNITLDRISRKTGKLKVVRRRIGSKGKLIKETGSHKPLGRLANAVGYKFYSDSNRVVTGFLSHSAVYIMDKLESGYQKPTTAKMKRFFWVSGIPIGDKSNLIIPAYATIAPMYQKTEPLIFKFIERRMFQYLADREARLT